MGVVFAAAQRSCRMGVLGRGEAMLTGLLVVATDIRGPREQAESGETGLLVPPATVAPLAQALSHLAANAPRPNGRSRPCPRLGALR